MCAAEGVPEPRIVTENGRAVTAHHSVLVVDVLGATRKPGLGEPAPPPGAHPVVKELAAVGDAADAASGLGELLEVLHDANEALGKAQALFQYGYLDLDAAALAELHGLLEPIALLDLKPDNLLVDAQADGRLRLVIADFGISKKIATVSQVFSRTALAGPTSACHPVGRDWQHKGCKTTVPYSAECPWGCTQTQRAHL